MDQAPAAQRQPYFKQFPRHLSTTVSISKVNFYRDKLSQWDSKTYPIPEKAWKDLSTGIVENTTIMPWISRKFYETPAEELPKVTAKWERISRAALGSLNLQMKALWGDVTHVDWDRLPSLVTAVRTSPRIREAFVRKARIGQFHHELEACCDKPLEMGHLPSFPWLEVAEDLVVLKDFPGGELVVPLSMVLCASDKVEAEFSLLLYSKLASQSPGRSSIPTFDLTVELYRQLDLAYDHYGNQAADLLKGLESITAGTVLQWLPTGTHTRDLALSTIKSIGEKSEGLGLWAENISSIFSRFLDSWGEEAVVLVLEQFGQEKMHYYPIVNDEAGLIKMYSHASAFLDISLDAAADTGGEFVKRFVCSYYAREGHLPPIKPSANYHPRIKKMMDTGQCPTLDECRKVPNKEWNQVQFNQCLPFSYFPGALDLLDDKAIAPHRSNVTQTYHPKVRKAYGIPPPMQKENTRLVIEMLERTKIDIKSYFDRVEKEGWLPREWSVILCKIKELELKIDGRAFSLLCFECRMMAATCERNISAQLFKYFPQQSMSMTGSELKFQIETYSSMFKEGKGKVCVMHIDFEQWNLKFRSRMMNSITTKLDQLFGGRHYRSVMKIFEESIFVSADPYAPPGTPDTFAAWEHHAGGNQGICQKLWTIITICKISSIMADFGCRYHLIGSGDNQVLIVEIPENNPIDQYMERIRTALWEKFGKIGLILKPEESWLSTKLLCYQRKYYFMGIPVPAGIKHATKAYSGDTDLNAGVNIHVTTAMNGGSSITEAVSDPCIGPLFALIEALCALLLNPKFAVFDTYSHEELISLTLFGSSLGGLPFLPFTHFLYNGHKDELCETLALIRLMWYRFPEWRPRLARMMAIQKSPVTDDVKLELILNPQGLNIHKPISPESIIKSGVEEFLTKSGRMKNQELVKLFSLLNRADQVRFAKELLKITPLHTSILRTLFENSVIGQVLHSVNRFTKITSIVNLVAKVNPGEEINSLRKKIDQADINIVRYVTNRLRKTVPVYKDWATQISQLDSGFYARFVKENSLEVDCSFTARMFLTNWTYDLGKTMPLGPYTGAPSEQVIVHEEIHKASLAHSIVVSPHHNMPEIYDELESHPGPFPYYVGSKTADPVRTIRLVNLEGKDLSTSIRTYLKVHAWLKSTGSAPELIDYIEDQIAGNLPEVKEIIPFLFSGTAGGTLVHRFEALAFVQGAFANSRSLISTQYQMSTNAATLLQRGDNDRFIFYQPIFHFGFGLLRLCHPYKHRIQLEIRLDHCSYKTPEPHFEVAKPGIQQIGPRLESLEIGASTLLLLKAEALHHQKMATLAQKHISNPEWDLAAYLAFEVCSEIRAHAFSTTQLTSASGATVQSQGKYNVTLLRMVDLALFLRSLGATLALANVFRCGFGLNQFKRALSHRLITMTTTQELGPYKAILEALALAGRIGELSRLTNLPYIWGRAHDFHQLLKMLLTGVLLELESWHNSSRPVPLLVEAKSTLFSFGRVASFLRKWDPVARENLSVTTNSWTAEGLFRLVGTAQNLKVILVSEKGLILERARSNLKGTYEERNPQPISWPTDAYPKELQSPSYASWLNINLRVLKKSTQEPTFPGQDDWLACEEGIIPSWSKYLSRWLTNSSGARLKLLEILSRWGDNLPKPQTILCLAEGAGSYLSSLLHLFPDAEGIYNSLLYADNVPYFQGTIFTPPEMICNCRVLSRLINSDMVPLFSGDLREAGTWEELKTYLGDSESGSIFVTWDMEGYGEGKVKALIHLEEFLASHNVHHAIIKLFARDFTEESSPIILALGAWFKFVSLEKPSASSPNTDEVFLVLRERVVYPVPLSTSILPDLLKRLLTGLKAPTRLDWAARVQPTLRWVLAHRPCSSSDPFTGRSFISCTRGIMDWLTTFLEMMLDEFSEEGKLRAHQDISLSHMLKGKTKGREATAQDIMMSWGAIASAFHITSAVLAPRSLGSKFDLALPMLDRLIQSGDKWAKTLDVLSARRVFFQRLGSALLSLSNGPTEALHPLACWTAHLLSHSSKTSIFRWAAKESGPGVWEIAIGHFRSVGITSTLVFSEPKTLWTLFQWAFYHSDQLAYWSSRVVIYPEFWKREIEVLFAGVTSSDIIGHSPLCISFIPDYFPEEWSNGKASLIGWFSPLALQSLPQQTRIHQQVPGPKIVGFECLEIRKYY